MRVSYLLTILLITHLFLLHTGCDSPRQVFQPPVVKDVCGDGKKTGRELCDTNATGDEKCLSEDICEARSQACTKYVLQGVDCKSSCESFTITACAPNDGCCPEGCTPDLDSDCKEMCGDGVVSGTETCDTAIPLGMPGSCLDEPTCLALLPLNACQKKVFSGSACHVSCQTVDIVACIDGDGCCPVGCHVGVDNDCVSTCGDGFKDTTESCDTGIQEGLPNSCLSQQTCESTPTYNACSHYKYQGDQCTSSCVLEDITACSLTADKCCPAGCDATNDTDCGKNIGEVCHNDEACQTTPGAVCMITDHAKSEGTCQIKCTNNVVSCSVGEVCTTLRWSHQRGLTDQYCLKTCNDDHDCTTGQSCQTAPSDSTKKICFMDSYSANLGNGCYFDEQCGFEGMCQFERLGGDFRGGDCYIENPIYKCPEGSFKITTNETPPKVYCVGACSDTKPCRQGYQCLPSNTCDTASRVIDFSYTCDNDEVCQKQLDPSDNRFYLGENWSCKNVIGYDNQRFCAAPKNEPSYHTKKIGDPCYTFAECAGDDTFCFIYDDLAWKGVCSKSCQTSQECGAGAVCGKMEESARYFDYLGSICMKQCVDGSKDICTAENFVCDPKSHGCRFEPPKPVANIGTPCSTDAECGVDGYCLKEAYNGEKAGAMVNMPDGFCTTGCYRAECPAGSACMTDKDADSMHFNYVCVPECTEGGGECGRTGYSCRLDLWYGAVGGGVFAGCWLK